MKKKKKKNGGYPFKHCFMLAFSHLKTLVSNLKSNSCHLYRVHYYKVIIEVNMHGL